MIDASGARELVRKALSEAEERGMPRCVLVSETLDYGPWWVQGYQSEAFAVSVNVFEALTGNGPFVVPKNGDAPFTLSSAEPVDVQMERLARRSRVGRRALRARSDLSSIHR